MDKPLEQLEYLRPWASLMGIRLARSTDIYGLRVVLIAISRQGDVTYKIEIDRDTKEGAFEDLKDAYQRFQKARQGECQW